MLTSAGPGWWLQPGPATVQLLQSHIPSEQEPWVGSDGRWNIRVPTVVEWWSLICSALRGTHNPVSHLSGTSASSSCLIGEVWPEWY